MFYRDRIFLLSISLLSYSPIFPSDPKESPNTEYVTTTHEGGLGVLPKSPDIEPQFLGTNRPIPSDVGSSAGGSIFNLFRAFVGPSEKELKREREIESLNKQLTKAMTPSGIKQLGGIPRPQEPITPESLAKNTAKAVEQWGDTGLICYPGMPQPAPKITQPAVSTPVVTPAPAPSVSIPAVSTPKVHHCSSIQVINNAHATAPVSSPSPAVSTPVAAPVVAMPVSTPTVMPAPAVSTPPATSGVANSSSVISGMGSAKASGGLQGSTSLLKPSFSVYDPSKAPTLDSLIPNKSYIKPMVTPPPVPNPPAAHSSEPSALEVAGAGTATIGMWGSIKAGATATAVAVKGAVVAATPYVVAVVTSPYVVIPVVVGASIYTTGVLLDKRSARLREEAAQAVRESTIHRQIHETVHTPTPEPQPHTPSTPNLHPNLQPSENPLKLGKKPWQPGPKEGQGTDPHGYKDAWGHYKKYTQDNVNRAIECATHGTYHGHSDRGHVFTFTCPETGWQRWTYLGNDGQILNCGINKVHATWNASKKSLEFPDGFKKPKGKGFGWEKGMLSIGGLALSSNGIEAGGYTIPNAPKETAFSSFEDFREKERDKELAFEATLREYNETLSPTLTPQKRIIEIEKAEKYLRQRVEKAENAYFGKNQDL